MEEVNVKLLTLDMDDRTVGILRLRTKTKVEVSLCFSQVSITHCMQQFHDKEVFLPNEVISGFVSRLGDSELPDFDQLGEIVFDLCTSIRLSTAIDAVGDVIGQDEMIQDQFNLYKDANFQGYWIPEANMDEESNIAQDIPAFSGFYIDSKPFEVGLIFSKVQAGVIVDRIPVAGLIQSISKSALPDDSLEPVEKIHGLGAEVFGFLLWLQLIQDENS